MKLSELMKGYTIDANYEGWVTNDDYVFAIDTNPGGKAATTPADFVVVEMGIAGLDSNLNPCRAEHNEDMNAEVVLSDRRQICWRRSSGLLPGPREKIRHRKQGCCKLPVL